MADKKNGKTVPKRAPAGALSKADAVRQAFGHLGATAMPVQVQAYLKKKFGIDVSANAISSYKTEVRRAAKKGKSPAALAVGTVSAARKVSAPKPKAPSAPASNGQVSSSVTLAALQTLKALLGRIGGTNLKTLIDVLAK